MSSHAETLPKDTLAGAMRSRCPWCGAAPEEATITLEALLDAWEAHELEFATRQDDGTAHHNALTADCQTCAKPFMVALQDNRNGRFMRLLPVRTAADARLLSAPAPPLREVK